MPNLDLPKPDNYSITFTLLAIKCFIYLNVDKRHMGTLNMQLTPIAKTLNIRNTKVNAIKS